MDKDDLFDMKYSLIINDILTDLQFDYEDNPEKYSIRDLNFAKSYIAIYELIKINSNDYIEPEDSSSNDDLDFVD